ncbi:uncharacterized protein [Euphorbia lathyris]|uniref:uncharacterized protein n=1 Tax=Euphorbia lathyris TaxID=212925 RepID=UPI0033141D02
METTILIPKKKRKLSRLIKAPLKLLVKARDLYIIGMGGIGGVIGSPTGLVVNTLPKSYSVNSLKSSNYNDDYRELVRAASARGLSNHNKDLLQRQQSKNSRGNNNNMPRSFSVGIGRIAEEKICDFDDEILVKPGVFSRSRSYAVGSRRSSNGVL